MKVGDLVMLKKYCRDSNRLALLIDMHVGAVKIMFVDTGKTVSAIKSNLEVINEGR